jgi:PadR family transcriptional regulator, regulatory protein PadR
MVKKTAYQNRIEILQGTLDLLILHTLVWGPQHGYGISQAIGTYSGSVLRVDTGSLYPALHRLEKQGWIRSQWELSDHRQRVKCYELTVAGRRQLIRERSRWQQLQEAMAGILDREPQGDET